MAENEGRQVAAAEDKPRATQQHEIDRGHDSRADELSEEHAAHLEALAAEDWERPSALLERISLTPRTPLSSFSIFMVTEVSMSSGDTPS